MSVSYSKVEGRDIHWDRYSDNGDGIRKQSESFIDGRCFGLACAAISLRTREEIEERFLYSSPGLGSGRSSSRDPGTKATSFAVFPR